MVNFHSYIGNGATIWFIKKIVISPLTQTLSELCASTWLSKNPPKPCFKDVSSATLSCLNLARCDVALAAPSRELCLAMKSCAGVERKKPWFIGITIVKLLIGD